jgi:hypothetical protein
VARPPRRDCPLLWHLGVVLAAALLPMIALEAFLLLQVAAAERARHEAEARDAARRIAAAVDRELAAFGAVLEVLASSDHLAAGDIAAFRRRARAVPRPAGAEIVLRTPAGRALATTAGDRGDPPAPEEDPRDPEAEAAAAATLRPQVSGLLDGPPPPRFSVVAPVRAEEGGRAAAAFLLSLEVPAAAMREVLARAGIPPRMTGTLLDRRGAVVTRSAEAERLTGRGPAPGAPALRLGAQREG